MANIDFYFYMEASNHFLQYCGIFTFRLHTFVNGPPVLKAWQMYGPSFFDILLLILCHEIRNEDALLSFSLADRNRVPVALVWLL